MPLVSHFRGATARSPISSRSSERKRPMGSTSFCCLNQSCWVRGRCWGPRRLKELEPAPSLPKEALRGGSIDGALPLGCPCAHPYDQTTRAETGVRSPSQSADYEPP